jgi:nucleoside 2-deoxyribosyltransferase
MGEKMSKFLVYLAGPITGCTFGECTEWRIGVREEIERRTMLRIECMSPMRAKEYLKNERAIADGYVGTVMSSDRGIMARDHQDATRADLLFVNYLHARTPSLGTAMELAWAYDRHIPSVVCIEDSGNPNDHAMLREATSFRVNSLEAGIDTVLKTLLPDTPLASAMRVSNLKLVA